MPDQQCVPVSVLMSVYNSQTWLGLAIESIQNQSFADFEFIIVNDGSTDESRSIILEYACKDDRIRLIDKANTGLTDSLNFGAKFAQGRWIARHDADDLAHKERLSQQIEWIKSDPDFKLVGTGHQLIDEEGRLGDNYCIPSKHNELVQCLKAKKAFFSHSSAMYDRECFEALSGYRTFFKRSQDYDMWLRFSEVGKISCIDRPLVFIRKHSDQISQTDAGTSQLIYSRIALYSHLHRAFGERDPVEFIESDIEHTDFYNSFKEELKRNRLFEMIEFKEAVKVLVRKRFIIKLVSEITRLLIRDRDLFWRMVRLVFLGENIVKKIYFKNRP